VWRLAGTLQHEHPLLMSQPAPAGDVAVVTPYKGQLLEIQKQLVASGTTVLLNQLDQQAIAHLVPEGMSSQTSALQRAVYSIINSPLLLVVALALPHQAAAFTVARLLRAK
jgi:hypothetical protein